MNTKKIVSIIFLVVFSLAIAGGGIYFLTQQSAQLLNKEGADDSALKATLAAKDIIYKINNGQEEKIFVLDLTASSTVFSVLEDLGNKEGIAITFKTYPEMGVLVESIGGVKGGEDNKYWQYWVNDILGEVAADKKFLKTGDRVEWKFDTVPVF